MFHNNYTQEDYKSYHVILPADPEAGTGAVLLGDLNAATDVELMRAFNVKTVITAATGLEHLAVPPEQTHIVFPLMDLKNQNIQAYFELSYHTIEQNLKRGAVLVHCGAGISRSATLVIAYYMKKYRTPFLPAIKHVRKCRPAVCPNLGFELQLKHYQELLGLDLENNNSKVSTTTVTSPSIPKKAKQMLLTFNAPETESKHYKQHQRMSNTNAKTSSNTRTPIPARKGPNLSSHKRTQMEADLLVVGHHPNEYKKEQFLEQSWSKQGWGMRRKNNHSYRL